MTHDRSRLTPGLLAALGFVSAVGPFATDMDLASFTDIAQDLGTVASSVQLTLTAFLIGIGTGQLVLGPLSDRWGRRPVLLSALAVFALSGAATVFSPTIGVFIALRFLQGFSGAAGVVVARAIAADLSRGADTVRALSLIATVVGLGPLLAPPIGGLVATVWGWRGVLGVLAAVSVAMLLVAALVIPESLPRSQRHAGGLGSTFRTLGGLVRDGGLTAYVLAFALAFATMMSYIAASPFVGQSILGMSPLVYSLGFAAGAAALLLANLANARLAPRFGARRLLFVGTTLLVAASAALTALVVFDLLAPWSFIACAFAVTAGTGFTMSNASALALARSGHASGSGSALIGASQFLLGGLVSPLVGLWGEHTALPMAITMTVAAAGAWTLARVAGTARPTLPRTEES